MMQTTIFSITRVSICVVLSSYISKVGIHLHTAADLSKKLNDR